MIGTLTATKEIRRACGRANARSVSVRGRGVIRALGLVVAVALVLTLAVGVGAADPANLDPDEDLDGNGTASDPYIVTDATELQAINGNLTAHYRLGDDVDASDTAGWFDGNGFDPIGNDTEAFTGSFDGTGHTISNLTIDRSSEQYVGLFGLTESGSAIEHVRIENASVDGDYEVGALLGNQSDGTTSRIEVVDGTVTAYQTGDDARVGGIIGVIHSGTLSESSVSTTVDAVDQQAVGGLVGELATDGTVETVVFTGTVAGDERVGGLVGTASEGSTVRQAVVAGEVTGNSGVGTIIGSEDGPVTVEAAYWDDDVTTVSDAIGSPDGGNPAATARSTAAMRGLNATVELHRLDFESAWRPGEGGYPELAWQSAFVDNAAALDALVAGNGESAPYEITTVYELQSMRYNLTANYELQGDIDASETAGWFDDGSGPQGFEPIAACRQSSRENEVDNCNDDRDEFTGTFDGGTYVISNLTIDRAETVGVGLFGIVTDGVIENVQLEDVDITGRELIGGSVGQLQNSGGEPSSDAAVLRNVSVSGTIEGSGPNVAGLVGRGVNANLAFDNAFRGSVTGSHEVGGILGRASGDTRVSYTYAQAAVVATGGAAQHGSGTDDSAGGIVGESGNPGSFQEVY